jgi:ATP-binding cassette subfamily B protein
MNEIIKIVRYSWVLKKYYLSIAAFVVITSVLNLATPFFLRYLVDGLDHVIHGQNVATSYFVWILVGILLASVITTVLSNVQGYLGDRLGVRLNTLLSQRYYDHLLNLPLEYYDNEIAGRVTNRLDRSIATVTQLIQQYANFFIGIFLTTILTLGALAIYAWPVAVMLGLLFPLYIWLTTLSSNAWQERQGDINVDTDHSIGRFVESIGQIRVVKSFTQERFERNYFAERRKNIEANTYIQSKRWHIFDVMRRLGLNLVFFFIYAYIAYMTYNGRISLGVLTLLITLTQQAQFPLFAASGIVDTLQKARAGSKDYFEVMDTKPTIVDTKSASALSVTMGHISYSNVTFSYESGQSVLNGVSFELPAGSKLALVGESGEGKTTISNLLLRFYEIKSGSITIDGQDISQITQESLRENIGVVFQEPALFSGTVRDNIAYGRRDASDEDVERAAEAANATGFIVKLPQGINTEIGERGVKLSGGQKQRIAIARAILKDSPILILDEATSSLDSRAEHEVQMALEELMKGRTTLIIAHRLSTIASADIIIGIQGGKVIEQGSPSELAKSGGIYAELLALQSPTAANKAKLKKYDIAR